MHEDSLYDFKLEFIITLAFNYQGKQIHCTKLYGAPRGTWGRKNKIWCAPDLFFSSQTLLLVGEVEARKPHYLVVGGSPINKKLRVAAYCCCHQLCQ